MKNPIKIFSKICRTVRELFYYPALGDHDVSYNRYWHERKLSKDSLNTFQAERVRLAAGLVEAGSSVLDIGCGNGAVLAEIKKLKSISGLIGVDVSDDALKLAAENGVHAIRADLSRKEEREKLPDADYICLFEVLEHLQNPEELLAWAFERARRGVFFSVPNTGYVQHRVRLLLGSFPLQWRVHPSEHVRFWTMRDMRWWLEHLGYKKYSLYPYQGSPFLKHILPGLFSPGLFVYIPRRG